MKNVITYALLIILGIIIGGVGWYLVNLSDHSDMTDDGDEEPLYWVAPMDPNYRRDGPGKSPMGMDLVPVYEEEGNSKSDNGPGTIRILPDVINNLGVRTAPARLQALHTEINTVGYVQYDEDKLVHIHPRISGWIEVLHVKAAGDPIVKNQKLYEIYSPELVNAQEELVLALERNNQRLIKAAEDRLLALQIPQSVITQLKKDRQVKQTVTIYAPQSGVLDNLLVREGFYVQPGTTMMSIGAIDEVWVLAEIFERQANLVKQGARVTMTLDYLPGRTWQGTVDYVYPTLDATTRTIKVRMRFQNGDGQLKPNMFAQVAIHSDDNTPTLLIPKEALIRTGSSERVVLAMGDGQFKSVNINTGRMDDKKVEILEGIEAGDEVVVSAQFLLDSESSITSDFKRMGHNDDVDQVWTQATINNVMVDHRMLTITHQPIPEWEWPVMTMDLLVADEVDLTNLKRNQEAHLQLQRTDDDEYIISVIHLLGETAEPAMDSSSPGTTKNTMDMTASQTTMPSQITTPTTEDNQQLTQVRTQATITEVMADHRTLTVSHEPIPEWRWPAMTMDFSVAEGVDLSNLKPNLLTQLSIEKTAPDKYEITAIQVIAETNNETLSTDADMQDMKNMPSSDDTSDHSNH